MSDAGKRFRDRIEVLLKTASTLHAGQRENGFGYPVLEGDEYTAWRMSALTVIKGIAPGSHFEAEFNNIYENSPLSHPSRLKQQSAVLAALRDDLDGGLLTEVRRRLRAEVLAGFLDHASRLLDEGGWQASSVILCTVLEDHLRKLCSRYPTIGLLVKPTLHSMNAELAKAEEYDALIQGQVTVWANVCDKAAHCHWTEFSADQVRDLIRDVRRFLVEHPA